MQKTLVFLGLLGIGFTYAQQGTVGINTNGNSTDESAPKATLDIRVAKVNENATTNEGILIPKLTKVRVVGIADGNRIEGTLVYVTDEIEDGDNANFIGTGKGFYFYNGTKWEKMGSGASSSASAENSFTRNARTEANSTIVVNSNDYFIRSTSTTSVSVTLPPAASNKGRVLCFYATSATVNTGALGNAGNVHPGYAGCIISDGNEWVTHTSA